MSSYFLWQMPAAACFPASAHTNVVLMGCFALQRLRCAEATHTGVSDDSSWFPVSMRKMSNLLLSFAASPIPCAYTARQQVTEAVRHKTVSLHGLPFSLASLLFCRTAVCGKVRHQNTIIIYGNPPWAGTYCRRASTKFCACRLPAP